MPREKKFVALKVVKSAAHYTETALDEIKLLKCVSFDILKLTISNLKPIHHLIQQSSVLFLVHIATAPKIIAGKFPIPGNVACIVLINSFNCTH